MMLQRTPILLRLHKCKKRRFANITFENGVKLLVFFLSHLYLASVVLTANVRFAKWPFFHEKHELKLLQSQVMCRVQNTTQSVLYLDAEY